MIITFHGGQLVRFQTGDTVIAANPGTAPAGVKQSKFGADIVLCSSYDHEHHSLDLVSHGDSDPFVIDGPGTYEFGGTTFLGEHLGKSSDSNPQHIPSVYRFTMDDITVCILGSVLPKDQLNTEASELFSEPGIVVIPITAENLSDAMALITFIDPKIIIPTGHWKLDEAALKLFLQEMGSKSAPEPKMTVKKKDVDAYSKHIALLEI